MKRQFLFLIIASLIIASCNNNGNRQATDQQNTAAASDQTNNHTSKDTTLSSGASSNQTAKPFDITQVPLSDKPLGAFPYFNLPDGYVANSNNKPQDFARFPFWVGDHFNWAEGKLYYNNIYAKEGKTFSQYEVEKNLDNLISQAGGVKIFQGKIPNDSTQKLEDNIKVNYVDGIGDVYNDPASVYVIRRKDKTIWVQFCVSSSNGGWVIMESAPFVQTASLVPASQLKEEIDTKGKAVIYVNFATDQATILPQSEPQIQQIVSLMQDNKDLKLSVNGYTDNTGTPAHNQQLSEARAQSVVKNITGKGITGSRLAAKGFGQNEPIGDNSTEAGKAENRRVELVKM